MIHDFDRGRVNHSNENRLLCPLLNCDCTRTVSRSLPCPCGQASHFFERHNVCCHHGNPILNRSDSHELQPSHDLKGPLDSLSQRSSYLW